MYYAAYNNVVIEFLLKSERDRYVLNNPGTCKKIEKRNGKEDRCMVVTCSCVNCTHRLLDEGKFSKGILCTLHGWEERLWITLKHPQFHNAFNPESTLAREARCKDFTVNA